MKQSWCGPRPLSRRDPQPSYADLASTSAIHRTRPFPLPEASQNRPSTNKTANHKNVISAITGISHPSIIRTEDIDRHMRYLSNSRTRDVEGKTKTFCTRVPQSCEGTSFLTVPKCKTSASNWDLRLFWPGQYRQGILCFRPLKHGCKDRIHYLSFLRIDARDGVRR